ncbi:hypothetical protein EON83_25845 [bacterium]|nr:MAG: hypothetical protein EON83_25845 [bacterium]
MFDIKTNSVVNFVTESGEIRTALVNSVDPESGQPNLTVLQFVDVAPHDASQSPGTWHHPSEEAPPIEEEQSVVEEPIEPTLDEPAQEGEELSEPA